jgi:hypothetical protein
MYVESRDTRQFRSSLALRHKLAYDELGRDNVAETPMMDVVDMQGNSTKHNFSFILSLHRRI